jgi:hypothetical protein
VEEKASFIHIVDVLPRILVQQLADSWEGYVDSIHVYGATLTKTAERLDSMAKLECFQPTV